MKKLRIIQDTREQLPFLFSNDCEVTVRKLDVGDYSLVGFEDQITIERKSLSDLLGSITGGRERFEKELRQMRGFRFPAIVVESSYAQIMAQDYRQNVHPNAVIGSLQAFCLKYGVQVVMGEDHATAAELTERLLRLFAKQIERDYRNLTDEKETA